MSSQCQQRLGKPAAATTRIEWREWCRVLPIPKRWDAGLLGSSEPHILWLGSWIICCPLRVPLTPPRPIPSKAGCGISAILRHTSSPHSLDETSHGLHWFLGPRTGFSRTPPPRPWTSFLGASPVPYQSPVRMCAYSYALFRPSFDPHGFPPKTQPTIYCTRHYLLEQPP